MVYAFNRSLSCQYFLKTFTTITKDLTWQDSYKEYFFKVMALGWSIESYNTQVNAFQQLRHSSEKKKIYSYGPQVSAI